MKQIASAAALADLVGQELGVSGYLAVDQTTIDLFAQSTGDHQWIHVDPERARREMPGGRTIAHGYLSLSLIPRLAAELYRIEGDPKGLNYGLNRVRFLAPVPVDSRLRLRIKVLGCENSAAGTRVVMENTMEIEGAAKPALLAETIVFYPAG